MALKERSQGDKELLIWENKVGYNAAGASERATWLKRLHDFSSPNRLRLSPVFSHRRPRGELSNRKRNQNLRHFLSLHTSECGDQPKVLMTTAERLMLPSGHAGLGKNGAIPPLVLVCVYVWVWLHLCARETIG